MRLAHFAHCMPAPWIFDEALQVNNHASGVSHFTKQKIHDVRGTITLRTNKNHRITLYECPTEMQAMIDLAKITDLALILIDASIGFEMESFEFLSLL